VHALHLRRAMATERRASLPPPPGLCATVVTMHGEEWLVLSHPVTISRLPEGLSPSECDVIQAVLRGLSNADIARERATSVHTIGNQMASVFKKLGVRSRLDLVRLVGVAMGAHQRECPRASGER
jgi:DNA-binding NarL/FixJ family response regulator